MEEKSKWILQTVEREFVEKFDVNAIKIAVQANPQCIEIFILEIQKAIDTYNENRNASQFLGLDRKLCLNAIHVASIFNQQLPTYENILVQLQTDKDLYDKVLYELKNSTYFKEVYEISDPLHLLQNLLVLFFRTSLLFLVPVLREKSAQISSTIEEMACALELSGVHTHLFLATKHWIRNWKEEEFSELLFKKLIDEKLL